MEQMDWLKEAIDYGVIGLLLALSVMVVAVSDALLRPAKVPMLRSTD